MTSPGGDPSERVLYLLGFLPTYVRREIGELVRRGRRVLVILPEHSPRASMWDAVAVPEEQISRDLEIHRLLPGPLPRFGQDTFRSRLLALADDLAESLAGKGLTRIHAHFGKEEALLGALLAEKLGVPFSVTTHANDIFIPRDPRALEEILERASPPFTISEFNRSFLGNLLGDHIGRRVRVTHLGVDLSTLPFPAQASRDSRHIACTASGLVEKKGVSVLLAACLVLEDLGVDFHCTIFGADPASEELRRLRRQVKDLGLEARVRLPGNLVCGALLDSVAAASIFVLPCLRAPNGDMDGIPVSLMEAMGMGVPVISTPISGIPELITDGVDGRLVPPEDAESLASAIQELLHHPEQRRRMGSEARKTVERRFSMKDHVDRMEQHWTLPNAELNLRMGAGPHPGSLAATRRRQRMQRE